MSNDTPQENPAEMLSMLARMDNLNACLSNEVERLENSLYELRGPDDAPGKAMAEPEEKCPSGHIHVFQRELDNLERSIRFLEGRVSELRQYI